MDDPAKRVRGCRGSRVSLMLRWHCADTVYDGRRYVIGSIGVRPLRVNGGVHHEWILNEKETKSRRICVSGGMREVRAGLDGEPSDEYVPVTSARFTEQPMKRLLIMMMILAGPMFFEARVLGVPGETELTREAIIGSWVHKGFYYVFRDSVMTAISTGGEARGYRQFRYDMQRMDGFNFIRYGKELDGSSGTGLLYVDDVTDSTAVLAFPTTFVRADTTSHGLLGTWRYVNDLNAVDVIFDPGRITYRYYTIDRTTGAETMIESRNGRIRPGKGKQHYRFHVTFDDETSTTLLPVLFEDLLYLYDLSPRKSVFIRTDSAPSFREFQEMETNGSG